MTHIPQNSALEEWATSTLEDLQNDPSLWSSLSLDDREKLLHYVARDSELDSFENPFIFAHSEDLEEIEDDGFITVYPALD